jgi:hypothetical protein
MVNVSLRGEQAAIDDYLGRLFGLPRTVRIDAMVLSSEGIGQSTLSLTLAIFSAAP